jgi:hypothetical protein
MNRPITTSLLLLMPSLSIALLGCLDFTPVTFSPIDAGVGDTSATMMLAADVDAGACEPCVQGPNCGTELDACYATPKCRVMFQCGLEQGCYAGAASNLVTCLTICGQQAGLTGQNDPAVGPFLGLYECATSKCATSCSAP